MAKVAFNKLGLKVDNRIEKVIINEQEVEVKKTLPIKQKIELIENIVNQVVNDSKFYNPVKEDVYTVLEVVYAYTNINFTDKLKEDEYKLYDLLTTPGGVWEKVLEAIDVAEMLDIENYTTRCIQSIYTFQNSAVGVLETVSRDYSNLNLDTQKLRDNLANRENVEFLQEVLTKLG